MDLIITVFILLVIAAVLIIFFSTILVGAGILIIVSFLALGGGYFFENILEGRIIYSLRFLTITLSIVMFLLVGVGRVTFFPLKFYRIEKATFGTRFLNIIFLLFLISLVISGFINKNIFPETSEKIEFFI